MEKCVPIVTRRDTSVLFVQTHQVMEGGLPRDLQLSPTQMVRLPPSVRRIPLRVTLVVTLSLRLTPMSSLGVTQGDSSPSVVSKALFQMRGWLTTSATSSANGRGLQFLNMVCWNCMSSLVTSSTINTNYVFQLDVPSALQSLDLSTLVLRCVLLERTSCLSLASQQGTCTHLLLKLVLQITRTWNSWALSV